MRMRDKNENGWKDGDISRGGAENAERKKERIEFSRK
jgi:hypothetical protein